MKNLKKTIPFLLSQKKKNGKLRFVTLGLLLIFSQGVMAQKWDASGDGPMKGFFNVDFGREALFNTKTISFKTQDLYHPNIEGMTNSWYAFPHVDNEGFGNSAIGWHSLFSNTWGSYNTANGANSIASNTLGKNNTANGYRALFSNITGNYNTALGSNADVSASGLSNATAIGFGAKVNFSGAIQLGNTDVTQIFAGVGEAARLFAGSCVIGTVPRTPRGYNLFVQKGILTEKVKVAVNGGENWADYVFAKDYQLKPLSEVETFVKVNKHLPGMLSAEEMVKEGNDLGATDAKLLEKIEELTLYMIEMNKKVSKLEIENITLRLTITNHQKQ